MAVQRVVYVLYALHALGGVGCPDQGTSPAENHLLYASEKRRFEGRVSREKAS